MANPLVRLDECRFPPLNVFKCPTTRVASETMGMVQFGWFLWVVFWYSNKLGTVPVEQ